jgi:uncharacterized protein (DUF2336 family)
MAATASAALVAELEGAADGRSPERWAEILRQMTRLFLAEAHHLNQVQIAIFDDVFLRLMKRADAQALALLGSHLSGLNAAPSKTVRQLAFHDDVSVAGAVLRRSNRLMDKDLVEIANVRGEPHLLEISGRQTINPSLGDKLVERGGTAVLNKLIQNLGATFSEAGYATLVAKATRDDGLAEKLACRSDIPPTLRRELVAKVSDTRMRSLQAAPSALKDKIQAAIATTAERVEVPVPTSADYSASMAKMLELSRKGELNDRSVNTFAVRQEYVDVVAALSFLSGAAVEVVAPLIRMAELDGLIVACKAARLNWSTTTMIIRHRPDCVAVTKAELDQGRAEFDALLLSVAQRTIRFW